MSHYKYLIIGGGLTADSAVRGIRLTDKEGSIGIISGEIHPPYSRPPLSKALWKGEAEESVWRNTPEKRLTLLLSTRAVALDTSRKTVTASVGDTHTYDKVLLATGGKPRRIPGAPDGVIYYRTLDDYRALRNITDPEARFVVIGGGFIGSEIAAALAMNAKSVTMIFPERGIGARVYPAPLSDFLTQYYAAQEIRVLPGTQVTSIAMNGRTFSLSTDGGETIEADAVIAGIGIVPETELAEAAGISVENGIVVDGQLRASAPDVYAAGDVASFLSPTLGKRIRVEHEDNAVTMGELAGRSMAGEDVAYTVLPFFYSDLFEFGYEAVGELDARHTIVEDWVEPNRKGVVYYLDQGRVRGVLLWNTWGQVGSARAIIAEAGPIDPSTLSGRIRD